MSLEKEYYIPSEVHIFLYILYVLSTDPYLIILDNILSHKTTQDLYDYINKNSESLFKDAPKNKKRISYLVADI